MARHARRGRGRRPTLRVDEPVDGQEVKALAGALAAAGALGFARPWGAFVGLVLALLAVDLIAHRKAHVIEFREALGWSAFYIGAGLLFDLVV